MKVEDARVIDWVFIDGDDYQDISRNMMEVLNQNISIAVGIHVLKELGSYGYVNNINNIIIIIFCSLQIQCPCPLRSGIYTPKENCDQPIQHAVVVVGYGTLGGIDYWIVRNSWGITWGDSGYVKMRRGINQCRIEDMPLYPILVY